jgi:hypothetical protein
MSFIVLGMTGLFILSLVGLMIFRFITGSLSGLFEPVLIGHTSFLVIFAMVSACVYAVNSSAHEDNLKSNLLQKYEIVSVDYDSEIAHLTITESESQLITINLKDDKKGNFLLTQDARTNEPALSELPESAVSVEEITR